MGGGIIAAGPDRITVFDALFTVLDSSVAAARLLRY